MRKLISALIDLIFPPKCPFCRSVLDHRAEGVCPICEGSLPHTGSERRRRLENGMLCLSALRYEGTVGPAVRRYKFSGLSGYAVPFGKRMAHILREERDPSAFTVTWVPLSEKRLKERGYDQARLLAEVIAEELGLEKPISLLCKIKDTTAQSLLTDNEARRNNVKGAYGVTDPSAVKEKHILLVDDVVTTGSTLMACAAVLRKAGAAEVTAVTLARAEKEKYLYRNPLQKKEQLDIMN